MKNLNRVVLIGCFLVALLNSSAAIAETSLPDNAACKAFETLRDDYTKSLGKDDSGKPAASEQSVALAWELTGAAEDCLAERGVAFERISTYALRIQPGSSVEPAKTAALLDELTKGAVIYDVGFFLRKPFAAGGFEENILFLPHSAIVGQLDMVTRHELNHARAHSLLLDGDQRLRHLWIFADDMMYVDEVLAYADGGLNEANAERMRSWSLDMAHQYISGTRELLDAPTAEIALSMDGKRCPMNPALKKEVAEMLSCIEGVLQTENAKPAEVAACDGQRAETDLCTP